MKTNTSCCDSCFPLDCKLLLGKSVLCNPIMPSFSAGCTAASLCLPPRNPLDSGPAQPGLRPLSVPKKQTPSWFIAVTWNSQAFESMFGLKWG